MRREHGVAGHGGSGGRFREGERKVRRELGQGRERELGCLL
jgi:hypothetical protein